MATNKFNTIWQLTRVKLKSIKDVGEKLKYFSEFMNKYKNKNMYERGMNWLRMTKLGYDDSIRTRFDKAISVLENNKDKWYANDTDDDVSLTDISDEQLTDLYIDLKNRKNSFQYKGKAPKDQVTYIEKLKIELYNRNLLQGN